MRYGVASRHRAGKVSPRARGKKGAALCARAGREREMRACLYPLRGHATPHPCSAASIQPRRKERREGEEKRAVAAPGIRRRTEGEEKRAAAAPGGVSPLLLQLRRGGSPPLLCSSAPPLLCSSAPPSGICISSLCSSSLLFLHLLPVLSAALFCSLVGSKKVCISVCLCYPIVG